MATIYRKSRAGQAEIETRALRLPPRLRNLLIMIDGRRDSDALQALLAYAPAAALQELLTHGLIEVASQRAGTPTQVPTEGAGPTTASMPAVALEQLRKDAVRALNDALGPHAETIAIRMERALTEAELRALIERAVQMIAGVRGSAAGRAYAARFLAQP